jgi:hypothetical protein
LTDLPIKRYTEDEVTLLAGMIYDARRAGIHHGNYSLARWILDRWPVEESIPLDSPAQCGHGIAVAGAWLECQNTPDHAGLHISGRSRWRTGGGLEPAAAGEVVSVPPPDRPLATGGTLTDPPFQFAEPEAGCTLTVPPVAVDRSPSLSAPVATAYGAPAAGPAPVPPPVDALDEILNLAELLADTRVKAFDALNRQVVGFRQRKVAQRYADAAAGYRLAIAVAVEGVRAAGVEEGRRQRDAEIHSNVLTSAREVAAEAGFTPAPESVTVTYDVTTDPEAAFAQGVAEGRRQATEERTEVERG